MAVEVVLAFENQPVQLQIASSVVTLGVSGGRGARGPRGYPATIDAVLYFSGQLVAEEKLGFICGADGATYVESRSAVKADTGGAADVELEILVDGVHAGTVTIPAGPSGAGTGPVDGSFVFDGGSLVLGSFSTLDVVVPVDVDPTVTNTKIIFGTELN